MSLAETSCVGLADVLAGTAARPSAVITSTIMFVYLVAGVRSFLKARATR
nr:hypothetical protein CPGR_02609 [Mycolicibacterium komanii]